MVNSGSFDAAGSEGESAKAEFTQLEDGDADAAPRTAASPRHLTDFAAVVPDTTTTTTTTTNNQHQQHPHSNQPSPSPSPSTETERDEGLTTPPQATMTTLNTTSCPPATPTKASLQCSVPLDKVKNVLEMCCQSSPPDKSKFNNFFILENYLKQKQKTNELTTSTITTPSATTTTTTTSIIDKADTESTTSSLSNASEPLKPTLKRLLCLFCDRTFTSNNLKQKHVDRCHSAAQTRRSSSRTSSQNQSATACCFCSKLNQTEHTLKELFEHLINEHSNRYYACLPCQERFTNHQTLRDHNKAVHGIEEAPVCDKISSLNNTSDTVIASGSGENSESSISADVIKRIKSSGNSSSASSSSDVAKSEAQTKSSPNASGKTLKRNTDTTKDLQQQQKESGKSVGFHVDFEDSILANIINPEDLKRSKETEDNTSDTIITTRKSRSSASNSKTKQNTSSSTPSTSSSTTSSASQQTSTNKKISVKSTKNGVRNIRTTRASVKQLNNFNKPRKSKVKSDSEPVQPEQKQKTVCNPASVFSLVNAYIYKYEKIYDHASDSIKDANSVQFNAVFDREFYLRTVCNIRENLLNHLDGKLNRNIESETRISHFEHNPALADAKIAKETDNFGCDLSLNAVTPVATLLASSQYGEDFDAQIEYGAKASQKKPKKVAVVKYKFPNKKYNSLFRERDGHTDLTSLDMWTQLTVKNRQSKVHDDGSFDSDNSPFFDRSSSGFEAKHLVDELNSILDKRGPFEDLLMEANAAQFLELRKKSNKDGDYISEESSKDVYFILDELLNRVVSKCNETDGIKTESQETETQENSTEADLEIPHYFQLQRSPNTNAIKVDKTDTIAQICSSKDENDKSDKRLELTGEWTRPRIYICAACGLKLPNLKSLDDHKNNDHPHIWCSHYEFVGNQSQFYRHLSIPGLGKVSVIESQPQNRVWLKSDARVCTKCTKQCHNLGELHKHILECGGDWTWMLARKKCKYRPYGARTRRRRQRGYKRTCNPEVSRAREKPKNKPNFIGPRPKPSKPSDAETIERMLANLPPKRNRKMISMRDGIQRPRKPYKQNQNTTSTSHLNSQKPPNKHFKNNSPQITKQTLRSALKRKLAMNNLRKQKGNDSNNLNHNQDNNVSVKLRSRIKNDETRDEIKNKDTEPLSAKSKLRNKRMISRILGSKIFDSNTAIVTRRRLVKAITQNNLMRKTRLRTKMLEANALKLEASQKEDAKVLQETLKDKRKTVEENLPKTVKTDKPSLENSTIDKTVKKSNSKRLLSVLTKTSKKPKTSETKIEDKPDTISAVINDVVNMAHREETNLEKSDNLEMGLRRTRSSNKLDTLVNEENRTEITEDVIPTISETDKQPVENKTEIKKPDTFGKTLGKKTSKLMQNVKSFRKNIRQTNENKTDPKNESIASKLIRTFSIRGSKKKKTNKTDDVDKSSVISFEHVDKEPQKDEFKKTTIDEPSNIVNENKETAAETSKTIVSEIQILEQINLKPNEKEICDPIVLPVSTTEECEHHDDNMQEKSDNECKLDGTDKDTDFKQSDEKLNANSGTLNKFKSKMKRSGRGLNDCIAMLKCKLEQKTIEPPLVDKSNLFILNSLEINKHSLVTETNQKITEESTKPVIEGLTPIQKSPILENSNSQDAMDLTMVSKLDTQKNILEVPLPTKNEIKLNNMQKKEQTIEVSTVEIQTQTFDEDIAPTLPEYLPHIQSNIQLSSLLNATLKNCLMECVKNKCEELRYDTQIVRKTNATKDRKIGSVRKKRTNTNAAKVKQPSDAVDKPPLNIPLLLNTAFTEKSKPTKLTNSPRTTTAEDTSEDDLPLSKLVSSSSVDPKLNVNISVAKKKRSAKKQIAFTPLILNSPDTCIPQISFQERLEQRISLNSTPVKQEEIKITKSESDSVTKVQDIEINVPNQKEIDEQPTTIISAEVETENKFENHPPLSEQVMSVEDEPLINCLVNKTLTETNVKPASSVKNAIPTENIELNKLECIDSGKENSDIQGIIKQKKTVKKTRGKRKSKGKLNATDSQIDYTTTLETPEKNITSSESSNIASNDVSDIKETSNTENEEIIAVICDCRKSEHEIEITNEEAKKKLKSPKKTADVASIIEAIEAAIQSSIRIQDEIDNRNKTPQESPNDETDSVIQPVLENVSVEEPKNPEEIKVDEAPIVVKKKRGRAKKVVEEPKTTDSTTTLDGEQSELKRTTRTKPKVNYVETEILDPVESMSEESNDLTKLLEDTILKPDTEITENLLENVDSEKKRVTRGKRMSYIETEIETHYDSEASLLEKTSKEVAETQVTLENNEKDKSENDKVEELVEKIVLENETQIINSVEKVEPIPVKVKGKRGRKPKNKNKVNEIQMETVASTIIETKPEQKIETTENLNTGIITVTSSTENVLLESSINEIAESKLNNETDIPIVEAEQNENKSEMNYEENKEIESVEPLNTDLDSVKRRPRSKNSTSLSETPEITSNSDTISQESKNESFLHPEEIKTKRKSRAKIVSPSPDSHNNKFTNLEMSSDDSSSNCEETKPKRRSRTRKLLQHDTDIESNSDLDVATSINGNEVFVNPDEIKVKRRSRGKLASNSEIDNESMSSFNSDESSTNPEEEKLKKTPYSMVPCDQEPDIPESKSVMETSFSVFSAETSRISTETKSSEEPDKVESTTDSEAVSSNELNTNTGDKKVKRKSRKKQSLDNIVSRLTETVNHEETSPSKITITIPLKTVQPNLEVATIPEITLEDNEKQHPRLKITIGNQKVETNNLEENIDISPIENSFTNKFGLNFENIKNKLKSRLEEMENVEPNTISENPILEQNSEENQIKRTPKLKITLVNPETENTEAITNSIEDSPEVENKKKKRSFIKIKLNLPPEPVVDESLVPEMTDNLTESEIKKKKRYRKKELELLQAPTFDNTEYKIQNMDTTETPANIENTGILETIENGEITKEETPNVEIEMPLKVSEEIPVVKPEPKKRGRKPKNAKKNLLPETYTIPTNLEVPLNLETSVPQPQLQPEIENKEISAEHVLEMNATQQEIDAAILENERKSRRSRPKINYQEIENDESTDVSSDSEISLKENSQDGQEIIPEELPTLQAVEEINDAEKKDSIVEDTPIINEQTLEEQTQNSITQTIQDVVNETKPKKKRGRKKASLAIEEQIIPETQLDTPAQVQLPVTTQLNVVTPKPRGRGRPSLKQKQEEMKNAIITPEIEKTDITPVTDEITEDYNKRKSRCKINYEELDNSTSIDSISNIELPINEEPAIVNTEEIITPHVPKKRGRKPKRKNLIQPETQTPVASEFPENIATPEEPINEEIPEPPLINIPEIDEVPQIIEVKPVQEDHLPILKIDMKKRRQLENESENTEPTFEEFNESCDEAAVHKIKKKRRSRSKNSETMSQQNIASAIELLTNVENTIESLKEFTKDKPLTNNFKNQLQENIEYEPESIMECKNIQELTAPSLNVTVDISPPPVIASDSEDELPLSILIKSKPDGEEPDGIIDSIPEINTVISENSLLDINVDEINFAKADNKLILSTHNSFDFDDDNIIDQEELSQLVDITSETLLENIENDYISAIGPAKEIIPDKILEEIKPIDESVANENDLDEIIEDLEIVTKLKTDGITENIIPPDSLDNLPTIEKSAEELLNLIEAEEETDFIKTPDLKDTSLIIKIKKNFNVNIRKAKKGRRRVMSKSHKNNIKPKEDEELVCEICNKNFKRKETLAAHKRTLTHIAKLSEIEARENEAKIMSENEHKEEVENDDEEIENLEIIKDTPEVLKPPSPLPLTEEILNADDESSCEITEEAEKTEVPETVSISPTTPQKTMNTILPGLIVNSTNSTLKLIDIINEVLDKPVSNLNIDDEDYSPQSIRKSPTSCDSTETFSEPKRYKSLGERKSFDSDSYTMTPKCNEDIKPETFNAIKPITNGEILCKQLSILENIMEETSPSLNNYIDDSVSLSSSQFEEPLPEPNITHKDIDYTKFSHTADVLSSFIKPNHFNNFKNISESFTKPIKNQEAPEHSQDDEESKKKDLKDNSTRKILNRDEELFLECCSLLKSGSEITGSKKSTKQIQLNSFSRSNDASWIMQKQQNSDRFIQRDSYSWLAQSSRVETPIGEPFVNNDWSNSNSAVSSEWLAQKAPSPDRPTESNTILKKSNNNSEESKYAELRFEDISIDSSLETSKTLMAVEHSSTENIPLDFHNVNFAGSNLQTPKQQSEEQSVQDEEDTSLTKEKVKNEQQEEDTSSREEYDPELKKKVVSAFGGLMAKALTNRLQAVVRKSKKSKGKRDLEGTTQPSITDYAIPVKKNKPNQTDSDSSDCPKKLITKGAMKVFEGIKVSIPTQDLNLKEVLNKTKKPEVEALKEDKEVELKTTNEKEKKALENKNGKMKHLFGHFGNKLGLREKKKKTVKRRSPKNQSADIYEFEESQDKSTFSLFKHTKENNEQTITTATILTSKYENPVNEAEKWNMDSESDTDRYYDSMSFEEQSLSSESTPESTTPIKLKPVVKKTTEKSKDNQKKCMIMGRIFKNASKPKLEDKIPEIRDFTSEENSKVVVNYLDSCSSVENMENGAVEQIPEVPNVPNNNSAVANNANKMSKKEMDMLFDKLLEEEIKMHEKEKIQETEKEIEINEDVFSKPLAIDKIPGEKKKSKENNNKVKLLAKPKKRQRHNSDSTSSDEFRLGGRQTKSTKRPKTHRKPPKPKKESGINLEQEMKECIGVAGRKSQRKCTSGKQNVLVEFWSSDESSFEEVLSLIEKQNDSKPLANSSTEQEIIEKEQIENNDDDENNRDGDYEEEEVMNEKLNEISLNSVNNCTIDKDDLKKPSLDIYDFESDAESKIEEFHPKPKTEETTTINQQLVEDSEFLAVNKMKIPKRMPKPKRNRKHSKNHDDESASEYEAEKTRRRNEHRRKKILESGEQLGGDGANDVDCLAISRRKRNAGDQLYYWSSSSDDELQDMIEVKPIREDTDDDRPMHHGWIVGDSPKKLVTMLAQAKGKKIDGESVKEQGKKNRVTL